MTSESTTSPRGSRLGMQSRAAVSSTLVAALIATVLAVVTYVSVRSFLIDQREESIEREAFANVRAIADELAADPDRAAELAATLGSEAGAVVLIRVDGRFVEPGEGPGADDLPAALIDALDAGEAHTERFVADGRPFAAVGVPIGGPSLAYVELFRLDRLDSSLAALRRNLVAGAGVAALGGAALGMWSTRRALRPLRATSRAAQRLTEGELDARLAADLDPDLDRLITAFNAMADSLTSRIAREERFASDVSHELRTPVATIRAATDVLQRRRGELGERGQEALDLLVEEVDDFDRLVVDLIEISRLDAGYGAAHAEAVVLPDLAARLAALHGHPDLVVEVADESLRAPVTIDRRRLERVVVNLLRNADVHGGGAVAIQLHRSAHTVLVVVDDAGPGVAPNERRRVFERFARGDDARRRPGSGLGLAIALQHARALGGTLTVTDRPGGGARFVCSLAVDELARAAVAAADQATDNR